MSVGLVLPPGSRTRANNLVVPFQEMDLTAHPYSVQEGTEEFYALFRRRYGEPKPEFYPFTDVSGSHASDFDAILRHIAQYDPTFFATMGLGNTGDGTGVPTEEEIHDAQYARGVGVVLFARADMVGPRPEPPAPPVPPIPPVIPPVEPPVPPGGPTIPEPPLPPFFFNDKAETAFNDLVNIAGKTNPFVYFIGVARRGNIRSLVNWIRSMEDFVSEIEIYRNRYFSL